VLCTFDASYNLNFKNLEKRGNILRPAAAGHTKCQQSSNMWRQYGWHQQSVVGKIRRKGTEKESGSQKATLVVLVVVVLVISSLKITKAFLIRSAAQRNFAHAFALIFSTDIPSQFFHFFF